MYVSSDYAECLTALEQNDMDASIKSCHYEYATDAIGLRVKNEAILIQGKYLSVFPRRCFGDSKSAFAN